MPHQCVRCSTMYQDGSDAILKGCKCGSRFFFYMKKEAIKAVKQMTVHLTAEDKQQLEQDALDLVGEEEQEHPIVLDLESIRMLQPGKFEIDLIDLFKGKPLVYKLAEGKYIIDIASTFKSVLDDEDDEPSTAKDDMSDELDDAVAKEDSKDEQAEEE